MKELNRCPRCGMERSEWQGGNGQGVRKDQTTYCCDGCAGSTGCTCRTEARSIPDRPSGNTGMQ